jgi:hypothetical protein
MRAAPIATSRISRATAAAAGRRLRTGGVGVSVGRRSDTEKALGSVPVRTRAAGLDKHGAGTHKPGRDGE